MRKSKKAFKDFHPFYKIIAETLIDEGYSYIESDGEFIFKRVYFGCITASIKIILCDSDSYKWQADMDCILYHPRRDKKREAGRTVACNEKDIADPEYIRGYIQSTIENIVGEADMLYYYCTK